MKTAKSQSCGPQPCIVLAAAQRSLPACDFGPVDLPLWDMYRRFPLKAAFLYRCLLGFNNAWLLGA